MSNYLINFIGWLIGQFTITAIAVYIVQLKNENIEYLPACRVYVKKQIGGYVIAFAALVILMFVYSDFIDPKITKEILRSKAKRTYLEDALLYSRLIAVGYGIFAQFLMLLIFRRGMNAIIGYGTKNGVDLKAVLPETAK